MSSAMTFKGSYRYGDAAALEAALAAALAVVESDDDDFPSPFDSGQIVRKGLVVHVNVDTSCPSAWYFSYEAIVETLAETAISGSVSFTIDDEEPETIPAGPANYEDDES